MSELIIEQFIIDPFCEPVQDTIVISRCHSFFAFEAIPYGGIIVWARIDPSWIKVEKKFVFKQWKDAWPSQKQFTYLSTIRGIHIFEQIREVREI